MSRGIALPGGGLPLQMEKSREQKQIEEIIKKMATGRRDVNIHFCDGQNITHADVDYCTSNSGEILIFSRMEDKAYRYPLHRIISVVENFKKD